MYGLLADLVVFVHVLYVGYVVLGQVAVVAAGTFRWEWGRNPWFRWSHLLAIAVVAMEELAGWRCPLTVWEEQLRQLAGEPFHGETFVAWLSHQAIFSLRWQQETFTAVHLAFAALVAQAFLMFPPRRFGGATRGE